VTAVDVLARTLPSLAVIVGALLVLRHWARRGRSRADADVRVLTRTGLAKGAVVAVVAVGERRLLVGASEQGVRLLTELEPDASVASLPLPDTAGAVTMAPMPAVPDLRRWLRPPASPPTTDRPRMAPIDRLRHLTVRRTVPSHPRRPTGVPDHT
jgi:flagellar protein FliO/FliZ